MGWANYISVACVMLCSPKVCRAYGNTGQCYEMLQQYPQAIFCHQKVGKSELLGRFYINLYCSGKIELCVLLWQPPVCLCLTTRG